MKCGYKKVHELNVHKKEGRGLKEGKKERGKLSRKVGKEGGRGQRERWKRDKEGGRAGQQAIY